MKRAAIRLYTSRHPAPREAESAPRARVLRGGRRATRRTSLCSCYARAQMIKCGRQIDIHIDVRAATRTPPRPARPPLRAHRDGDADGRTAR